MACCLTGFKALPEISCNLFPVGPHCHWVATCIDCTDKHVVYYPVLGIRYDILHIVIFRISLIHWRVFAIMRSLQYNQCQDSMRHKKNK